MGRAFALFLAATVAAMGCAAPGPGSGDASASGSGPRPLRTLTMMVRYEVTDLAPKIPGSSSPVLTKRIFNADLAFIDGVGAARPYLAEALPQLDTESWRVFPDGRMETIYRLRPGLVWHDGAPLTAEDFVFAFRVYTAPGLGIFRATPQDKMEMVLAPDPRTIAVRWRTSYPEADVLKNEDFEPLPKHILEAPFAAFEEDPATREAFLGLPFWTSQYVGAGPYRLERWEFGSHLEGSAFDGHALGRPRIDRIVVRIIGDENTVLSNVLAGQVDFTTDFALRFEHALVLRREWEAAQRGRVLLKRSGPVSLIVQLRPEYVEHPAQLDIRVRKALAHSMDRQALNDGLFEGQGFLSETIVREDEPHFAQVDRAVAKHPYDQRRTDQLMGEAGFTRDRAGLFAGAPGERFRMDLRVTGGPEFERAQAILADGWRRGGFDVRGSVLPAAQARDVEARQTFPGLASRGGGLQERTFTSTQIGSPGNRWTGENRGGWSNGEYDRLFAAFEATLDREERVRQLVRMHQLLSEELPALMLYHAIQVNTHAAGLRGPTATATGLPYWNIHEWELR